MLNEAVLRLRVPRVGVGAEAALVREAAAEEAHAQAQVVVRLKLLAEQLLGALPAELQVVLALRGGWGGPSMCACARGGGLCCAVRYQREALAP